MLMTPVIKCELPLKNGLAVSTSTDKDRPQFQLTQIVSRGTVTDEQQIELRTEGEVYELIAALQQLIRFRVGNAAVGTYPVRMELPVLSQPADS